MLHLFFLHACMVRDIFYHRRQSCIYLTAAVAVLDANQHVSRSDAKPFRYLAIVSGFSTTVSLY